ncbi:MAG: LamG domain-containing protein [Spirochaetota bacterium]|nr:LamG domain-containing protein [Spirochaetota bacterium]
MGKSLLFTVAIIILISSITLACSDKPKKNKAKKSSPPPRNLITHNSSFNEKTGEFIPDPHTVALWHFNEGKDVIATDSTVNNNAGVINGGTPWVNGRFGLGLRFANSGSTIEIEDSPQLTPRDALTVEFWLYIEETQTKFPIIFSKDSNAETGNLAGNPSFHMVLHNVPQDQSVTLRIATDMGLIPMHIKDVWRNLVNGWHYFAITYDSRHIRFYVDGELLGKQAQNGKIIKNNNHLTLGNRTFNSPNNRFQGIIDEMRISNVARSHRAIRNYWKAVSKK